MDKNNITGISDSLAYKENYLEPHEETKTSEDWQAKFEKSQKLLELANRKLEALNIFYSLVEEERKVLNGDRKSVV